MSIFSLCLSLSNDPPSTRTLRSGISGSPLVCLNRDLNQNSKDFHRRWFVYWQWQLRTITPLMLTRSSDNLQFTSRFSRTLANCLLSAAVAHLTLVVWGGRLTSYLVPTHKPDFESRTPATLHRHTGAYSNSKSASKFLQKLVHSQSSR